jgi:hypothetical protein
MAARRGQINVDNHTTQSPRCAAEINAVGERKPLMNL